MSMIVIKGTIRNGQVEVEGPINLPDGSEVTITGYANGKFVGLPDYGGPTTQEEIAATLDAMEKIEPFEMKMASLGILVPPFCVLAGTAVAVLVPAGTAGMANPGAHGFSEVLYAFSSASNNNGSAFAGLSANTTFYNVALALCMFFGRYFVKIPVLAIAGSLAAKKIVPATSGTLPTHTPLFVVLIVSVVVIVGALTFIPALALGPIVEHLMMKGA